MSIEVKIPEIGESISEVTLGSWLVEDGDQVDEGDIICEIESDKATVELPAESAGVIKIKSEAGSDHKIGDVIAEIKPGEQSDTTSEKKEDESSQSQGSPDKPKDKDENKDKVDDDEKEPKSEEDQSGQAEHHPSPAARKILAEKGIDPSDVKGSGKDGRITKEDALNAETASKSEGEESGSTSSPKARSEGGRQTQTQKMTRLRKTIAKRLVESKNNTAMLTTFNEVDMSAIMELRKKYKDKFKEKYDVNLGFMSFFTKACTQALKEVPAVNSQIDGENIISHDYADVGIAVSSPKGLVVPVVRNAESLSLAEIEREIIRLAKKARDGKISIDEMEGGTFTITNGGIFGSMLSTPIINLPQSAILGMHNIVERPVAVNGQVEIRPVMYVALSYDHRIIDGRESVTFLYKMKEMLEDPARLLLEI